MRPHRIVPSLIALGAGRPVSRIGQNSGSLGSLLVLMCLALAIPTLPAHADLQLLSPNGGESWPPGSQQTIQWTGTSDPVTIQLFVDGAPSGGSMQGLSTTLATNATGGSFSFTVPDVATTRTRVQISQVVNGVPVYAYSAGRFTMATLPPPNTWSYVPVDASNQGWNQSDLCDNGYGGVYAVWLDYLGGGDLRFETTPWASPIVAKSDGNVGSWPSIVCASNGTVHIAYYDYTVGSAKLYYTSGDPAHSSPSSWPQEFVSDIGVVQGDCSIALDDHNNPYIAFNTGTANGGGYKLRVFKRQNNGTWASFGNWLNEDITWPHHITLKFAGNNQFWVACTDQQTATRLNLWKYNGVQWVKLNVTNFVPGPYTDVSLALDPFQLNPYLAYTVPSNGGQNLIFHPWAQDGSGMGTPVTIDPTLGTIPGVSLQWRGAYPRIGYVGNGVVKQATGIYSATLWPCDFTRQVVDATGNMDAQVSLVVLGDDTKWYLYRNLYDGSMASAEPYNGSGGGGGGPPHHGYAGAITIVNGATEPERLVVSGGLSSTPIRFQFVGGTSLRTASVDIYDVQGRFVRALAGRGDGDVVWDMRNRVGSPVVPGVYFYRAVAGSMTYQGKAIVSR